MSMHLCPPYISSTGKRKGKVKYRNSTQASRARQAQSDWQDLLKKHGATQDERKQKQALNSRTYVPPTLNYRGKNDPKPQSLETTWAPCTKTANPVYTGDKIIGIGTLHKSNAVPIFSDQEAQEIARMRR